MEGEGRRQVEKDGGEARGNRLYGGWIEDEERNLVKRRGKIGGERRLMMKGRCK